MATPDIIFDVKTVDTQLAQMYINNTTELHSIGFPDNGSYEYDKFKNKIYFANIDAEPEIIVSEINYTMVQYLQDSDKLFDLAKLIEKNADLFCQLEYLIRGIPVDDVKNNDLKLIIDNLLYCNEVTMYDTKYNNIYCDRIAFLADTPLAALGFIAQSLCYVHRSHSITIISNKDTAIISFLFVDLCRQVGFEEVFLQVVPKDADCSKYNILEIEELSTGGVGIVTSKCDVDSAVDAFISSTNWYPWRVNKIFVQECVLERFKRVLAWKSEMQAPGCRGDDLEVPRAASYRCGEKVFALEAKGESGERVVALEAYRTVRELLVLLGALRPLAASLWSSDVAESLEITHGLSSTIVWVNNFADFRGPPRVSQSFYSVVDVHFSTLTMQCGPKLDTLESLRMSWLQLSEEERQESMTHDKQDRFVNSRAKAIWEDSFLRVIEKVVVTSTISSSRIWYFLLHEFGIDKMIVEEFRIIKFLIKGGGLMVNTPVTHFGSFLKIKGIPVVTEKSSKKETCRLAKVLWKPTYEHKVIWTNYGTMFAN